MPDHIVKLHYKRDPQNPSGKPLFTPEPNPIFIKNGHTIVFQKADDSLPGQIRVSFHNPEILSAAVTDGSAAVHVTGTPIATTYHCELLDSDGRPIAESHENQGGDMLPEPPPAS